MPFQTRNLWMVGLGTVGDVPPNSVQPALHDGMHLRWTFDPARGIPWFGYYLLRRDSGHRPLQGCISNNLKGQAAWAVAEHDVSCRVRDAQQRPAPCLHRGFRA